MPTIYFAWYFKGDVLLNKNLSQVYKIIFFCCYNECIWISTKSSPKKKISTSFSFPRWAENNDLCVGKKYQTLYINRENKVSLLLTAQYPKSHIDNGSMKKKQFKWDQEQ